MQSRAIGIILSGGDGDGTDGCRPIRAKGGITFAQDLSADVDGMPLHAQAAGCVDEELASVQAASQALLAQRIAFGERAGQRVRKHVGIPNTSPLSAICSYFS